MSLLKKALENMVRHWVSAIPAIVVVAVTLTMFHGLLGIREKADQTLQNLSEKLSFTVYLKDSADPFEVGKLITGLEDRNDVKSVSYTSQESAWERMAKTFSLDPTLLKKYRFQLPASITVTPKNPEYAVRIEKFVRDTWGNLLKNPLPETRENQENITAQMISFLKNIRENTERTLFFLVILFVFGGAILMSSTVFLSLSTRKLEMNIMKLVGAAYRHIAAPFIAEGVLLGIFAYGLHLLLLFILPVELPNREVHLNALLLEAIASMAIAGISSYVTVMTHLHKKTLF